MLRISQYLFQGYLRDLEAFQTGVRQSLWLEVYDPPVLPKGRPRTGVAAGRGVRLGEGVEQNWAKFGPAHSRLDILTLHHPSPLSPETTPMELASKNQGSFINKEQQNGIGDIH